MSPRPLPPVGRLAGSGRAAWASWRTWGGRRHLTAVVATIGTVLFVALPTALIPNPVFGRDVPPTVWAWPVLLLTAGLSGLLVGTYVRQAPPRTVGDSDHGTSGDLSPDEGDGVTQGRAGLIGGLLTFLAVGCPVCNKLALLALGYAGALQWFAPVQPFLAAGGIVLLVWALVRRLENDGACPLPRRSSPQRATISR